MQILNLNTPCPSAKQQLFPKGITSVAKVIAILLLFYINMPAKAGQLLTNSNLSSQPFSFEQNLGQLADEHGKLLTDILYFGKQNGANVYCFKDKLAFVFVKADHYTRNKPLLPWPKSLANQSAVNADDSVVLSTSRVEMQLMNASSEVQIIPAEPVQAYNNYRLAHCQQGITAHSFNKITYKNIYPLTDLVLTTDGKGIEYSFVVYPGGNPDNISIKWNGTDKIVQQNESVSYKSLLGYLNESGLSAILSDGTPITCGYRQQENIFTFKVSGYPKNQVLTIDPWLNWATYFGSSNAGLHANVGSTNAFGITTDDSDNVYICGNTNNVAGIATSGAYQTSFGGSFCDVFVAKFTADGSKRIWSTYLGGHGYETAYSLTHDGNNLYVTGSTSSDTVMATAGAYKTRMPAHTLYAFLSRINTNGQFSWSTYFGGDYSTEAYAVAADKKGDIYFSGNTTADTGIASVGAFQTSHTPDRPGAFLAKFSPAGKHIWSTFYADTGSSINSCGGIAIDASNNIVISGGCTSQKTSYALATSGSYRSSLYGSGAFIATFSDKGSRLWGTYFYGTPGYYGLTNTQNGLVSTDATGNIYLGGITTDTAGITTSGAYQQHSNGNGNYLAKFSSKGNLLWATYYGGITKGQGMTHILALCTDPSGNTYLTGQTQQDTGLATKGAYQSLPARYYSAFIAKFTTTGKLAYGSYFAGNIGAERGSAITYDKQGNVLFTGSAGDSGIATSGAYQTQLFDQSDAYIASFWPDNCTFNLYFNGNTQTCYNSAENYIANKHSGISYKWKALGGTILSGNNTDSVRVKWTVAGHDSLWVIESNGHCKDSFVNEIIVHPPMANGGPDQRICLKDTAVIGSSPAAGTVYSWSSIPAGFVSGASQIKVSPDTTTSYILVETDTVSDCSLSDTVTVKVNPLPAIKGIESTVCSGDSILIGNAKIPGLLYSWTSKPSGYTSSAAQSYVLPPVKTVYYLTATDSLTGCTKTDSFLVNVNSLPPANAGNNKTICSEEPASIGTPGTSGYSYLWSSNPAGFNDTVSDVIVKPLSTTTYYLSVTNISTGCVNTDSVVVTVKPAPHALFGFARKEICLKDTLNLVDSSSNADTYLWQFGDGDTSSSNKPMHRYAKGGSYTLWLKVTNSNGCTDSISHTVVIDSSCVWPGDANYDKKADIFDALAVGIAYSNTGPVRSNASSKWVAQPCNDWTKNFKSGANFKHADCNGDGKVDSLDLKPIIRNYGDTHAKTDGNGSGNPNDPSLYLSSTVDSIATGDTMQVLINLGTSAKKVSNVYGIAFSISYDNTAVDTAKPVLPDFSDCWLGTPGKDLITLVHNNPKTGQIDIALSRTDHNDVSGYGHIGNVGIIIPDNVAGKMHFHKKFKFSIDNIKTISADEKPVSLNTQDDSVIIYQEQNSISNDPHKEDQLLIYPNPTSGQLYISSRTGLISQIQVVDITGRILLTERTADAPQYTLNTQRLSPGIYYINVLTTKGMVHARFIKE